MNETTHWRKILESEYLAAADLDDGKGNFIPVVYTITKAGMKMVREVGTNKEEKCLLIHFKEFKKPMIVNVTNATAITKACGSPYLESWPGHKIKIGTEPVKAFGELWDALRVKPFRIEPDAPVVASAAVQEILCADCHSAVQEYAGVSATKLARVTTEKYGRALCYSCSRIAKEKLEEQPNVDAIDPEDEAKLPFDT